MDIVSDTADIMHASILSIDHMAAPTFSSFPSLPKASTSTASGSNQGREKSKRTYEVEREDEDQSQRHETHRSVRKEKRREKEYSDRHSHRDRRVGTHDRKGREERRYKHREEAIDLVISKEHVRSRQLSPEQQRADFATWYDSEPLPAVFADVVIDKARFNADYTLEPPTYRRRSATVIGLPSLFRVEYGKERSHRGIELSYRDIQAVSSRTRLPPQPPPTKIRRLVLGESDPRDFDSSTSFVPFGTRPNPRRNILEDEITDDDFELEFADLPASDVSRRERVQALEKQLRDDPGDIDAWLSYSTQHLDKVTGDPLDGPFNKSQAEISLFILDKAIKANHDSAILHLAYIRVAQQISSPDEIGTRWRASLTAFPISADRLDAVLPVWMAYLGWCQTEGFGTFRNDCVEGVLAIYQDLMGRLKDMLLHAPRNSQLSSQLEAACLYLALRVALFLKQGGYAERAFALFQAIIEITFFKPTDLVAPMSNLPYWWNDLIDRAEKFWSYETPRFGEAGSAGWNAGKRSQPAVTNIAKSVEPASSFEDWYDREITADRGTVAQRLMEAEDDPHSVVLFDDIRPFLIPILSAEMRLQTVFALLTFLGVTFVPPDTPTSSPQAMDPFLHWSIDSQTIWSNRSSGQAYPWRREAGASPAILSDNVCRYWAFDVDTLFARPKEWFSFVKAHSSIDLPLTSRCMAQLQPLIPDPRFGMMMLALEGSNSAKVAAFRAKAMLSSDRNNLNLWNAYANLEIGRHRYDSARSVFANALSFTRSLTKGAEILDEDELDLLAGWVQMESDLGEYARAIDLLVLGIRGGASDYVQRASTDFVPPQPTAMQLLKLGQYYETRHTSISSAYIRLHFFYLTLIQQDISKACSTCLAEVKNDEDITETTYQFLLRQLGTSKSKASQREMRNVADSAAARFPHNTIFRQMVNYLARQRSQRAAEQAVEGMLSSQGMSVIQLLWGIGAMADLSGEALWKTDGSGAARLRGVLSRAVQTNIGRQSSILWRLYIEFESMLGSPTVKQLCYRAVSSTGSVKALYMLPFSPSIRQQFSSREHREWLLLMVERGLRIRVPIEDLLEVEEVDQLMLLPSDEEPEDDELAFLQETQKLKPYA